MARTLKYHINLNPTSEEAFQQVLDEYKGISIPKELRDRGINEGTSLSEQQHNVLDSLLSAEWEKYGKPYVKLHGFEEPGEGIPGFGRNRAYFESHPASRDTIGVYEHSPLSDLVEELQHSRQYRRPSSDYQALSDSLERKHREQFEVFGDVGDPAQYQERPYGPYLPLEGGMYGTEEGGQFMYPVADSTFTSGGDGWDLDFRMAAPGSGEPIPVESQAHGVYGAQMWDTIANLLKNL